MPIATPRTLSSPHLNFLISISLFLFSQLFIALFFFICYVLLYCSHIDPISSSPSLNAMSCLYSFGPFPPLHEILIPLIFLQNSYLSRLSSSVISSVMPSPQARWLILLMYSYRSFYLNHFFHLFTELTILKENISKMEAT